MPGGLSEGDQRGLHRPAQPRPLPGDAPLGTGRGGGGLTGTRSAGVRRAGVAQAAFALLLFGAWCGGLLALPLDPDYTAGELLDHLLAWTGGEPLYSPLSEAPWRVLNYPPAFLVAARGLHELGVPALLAGRALNGLALVALVALVARWLREEGTPPAAAVLGTGALAASLPVLLAAGQFQLELWGAVLLLAGARWVGQGRGWVGGLALGAACLVKHAHVVPGLAVLAWALRYRRRSAPAAGAGFAGVGLAGAVGISLAFGAEAWTHLLTYTVGSFEARQLGLQLASFLAPWSVLGGIGVWVGVRDAEARRDVRWWLFVATGLWGAVSSARVGASYPYWLPAHLAALVWVAPAALGSAGRSGGEAASTGRRSAGPAPLPRWAGVLLAAQLVVGDAISGAAAAVNLDRTADAAATLAEVCPPEPGLEVVAGSPGYARACGARPLVHPFIATNLARRGLWDPSPLVARLGSGAVPAVLLPTRGVTPRVASERWLPSVVAAVGARYGVVVRRDPWARLAPDVGRDPAPVLPPVDGGP